MNPAKVLFVSVVVVVLIGALLWPLFARTPDYPEFTWMGATAVASVIALLFGADILPPRLRRRLFTWMSHD